MSKSRNYVLSVEVYKYPYCGRPDENEDYLSEKICRCTIKIRKKIVRKTKRVFVYGQLILSLGNGLAPTQAIGLPILTTTPPIMRSIYSDTSKKVIIAQVINNNPEKIIFNEKQMDKLYDLAVKYRNNSMSREELILELRGGGIENWLEAFGIIIAIITLINNADAFLVPPNPGAIVPPHLQWLYGNQQPGYSSSSFHMEKPSAMPHQEYTSLTKEQKRNLPDPRDGFIDVEGHPHLVVRYGQVEFKTPDHGRVHGLPVNANGKTPKTEANALTLRESLVNMPNRKDIVWFDNGMYQGGTTRGYDSVNIFDKDTDTIAVFKKDENGKYSRFTTTCTLTDMERKHLFKSGGNFVTEALLRNQKGLTLTNLNNNKK